MKKALSRTSKVYMLSMGSALSSIFGIVIYSVLSRIFTKEVYGIYRQLLLYFSMVIPFLSLGLPMALFYYLPSEKQNSRRIIFNNLIFLFVIGSFFVLFIFLGGANIISEKIGNFEIRNLIYIASPYVIFELLRKVVSPCLMSFNKARLMAIFTVISRISECFLVLSAAFIFRSLNSVIWAKLLAALIILIFGLRFVFYVCRKGSFLLSFTEIKRQLFYGIPLSLAGIFAYLTTYLDQLIVSSTTSPKIFAIYTNGAIKLPFLSIIVMSISAVLLPELTMLYKNSNKKDMLKLWQNTMIKSAYIMLPLAVFFMFLAQDIIVLLFSEKYLESVQIFRIFLILLPFQMISYGPIFHASNRNKYIILINIITLVIYLPLLYFFIQHLGIYGAAIATVFSQICIRILLHIVFIAKIVESPVMGVIPFFKIYSIFITVLLLSIPLITRIWVQCSSLIGIFIYGLYYFPICYIFLTRKQNAPRIKIAEKVIGVFK